MGLADLLSWAGGSSTTINYPEQPSYSEGMKEAMLAQVNLLKGEGDFASTGGLKGLLEKYEAPLRESAAQIDTDVLRQTILGDADRQRAREVTQADIDNGLASAGDLGKVGMRQVQHVFEKGNQELSGAARTAVNKYEFMKKAYSDYGGKDPATWSDKFRRDAKGAGFTDQQLKGAFLQINVGIDPATTYANDLAQFKDEIEGVGGKIQEKEMLVFSHPETGEPLRKGEVIRGGEGMVDLLGDTRDVQESVQGDADYGAYVENEPGLKAAFERENKVLMQRRMPQKSIEEWGREHYEDIGKAEGREVPGMGYSLQSAGRAAGFDELGNFQGLSALAEDIGRGGQQRAREADISDVERLGGRATDAYRAQGDLSGALAQARGIGAGGEEGLSAIPKDPLFEGAALDSLAARTKAENLGIGAITSEGMDAAHGRAPKALTAQTSYARAPDVMADALTAKTSYDARDAGSGGSVQAKTLRGNLLQDARDSLAGGLTAREERQISEAMKAQSTMMGRTFDQSAGLAEAKARLLEDRNRQALNRQYAQQVLGQEASIQTSDADRGQRSALANAAARNAAAQFGIQAGLQQEQAGAAQDLQAQLANQASENQQAQFGIKAELGQEALGAQLAQQTALANQAAQQEAARYTAQEGMQAKQMELGRQTAGVERQLTAEEKDIERLMRQQAMEEQYRQQGLGAERASAAQMVGLEQATSADPFQAILQRQGQNNLASGGALFGQAGYGLQSGPQYLNPEAGLGFIQNQATNAANMFGAQSMADATVRGSKIAAGGNILSSFIPSWSIGD